MCMKLMTSVCQEEAVVSPSLTDRTHSMGQWLWAMQ